MEYEKRRNKRVQYYESVRHAQTVSVDDIPLPQMSEQPPSGAAAPTNPLQQQLPSLQQQQLPDNLRGDFAYQRGRNMLIDTPAIELPPGIQPPFTGMPPPSLKRLPDKMPGVDEKRPDGLKEPPGCPPGPPPDLHLMRELDSDYEDEENIRPQSKTSSKPKRYNDTRESDDKIGDDKGNDVEVPKPTSVQQRILAIAGQKYDDFMKDLENIHKNKERSKSTIKHDSERLKSDRNLSDNDNRNSDNEDSGNDDADSDDDNDDDDGDDDMTGHKNDEHSNKNSDESDLDDTAKAPIELPNKPSAIETIVMPRPPPAPPMPMLPSGPPPPPMGMPPAMMFRPPPMRPGLQALGIRMPPGMPRIRMPPGPPPGLPPSRLMHGHHKPHTQNPIHNTLQAGPQLTNSTKGMTTITAKPQIRNLSADVTRFVPSTLRVKREDKKSQKPKTFVPDYRTQPMETAAKGTTKDDAYMQFMREMQGLL